MCLETFATTWSYLQISKLPKRNQDFSARQFVSRVRDTVALFGPLGMASINLISCDILIQRQKLCAELRVIALNTIIPQWPAISERKRWNVPDSSTTTDIVRNVAQTGRVKHRGYDRLM